MKNALIVFFIAFLLTVLSAASHGTTRLFYDEGIRCLGINDDCYHEEDKQFLDDEIDPPILDSLDFPPNPCAWEENLMV